jgi:hypothetical protein
MRTVPQEYRRHAFVGVGWIMPIGTTTLRPTLVTISNALDAHGEWRPVAASSFSVQEGRWGRIGAGFGIAATGQSLQPGEKYAIWRLVRCAVKHGAEPGAIVRALVIAMGYVASRYPLVGSKMLVTSMPRRATQQYMESGHFGICNGPPSRTENTFLSLSPNAEPAHYGPNIAGEGIAVLGWQASTGPGWSSGVTMGP